ARSSTHLSRSSLCCVFFSATAPTGLYTLSLHDALPILVGERGLELPDGRQPVVQDAGHQRGRGAPVAKRVAQVLGAARPARGDEDRKSTRLNSSHVKISYAVFCLKKKKRTKTSCSVVGA